MLILTFHPKIGYNTGEDNWQLSPADCGSGVGSTTAHKPIITETRPLDKGGLCYFYKKFFSTTRKTLTKS